VNTGLAHIVLQRGEEAAHHFRASVSALNLPYFCFHRTWSAHRPQQPAALAATACSSADFSLSATFLPRLGWNAVALWCTFVWSCDGIYEAMLISCRGDALAERAVCDFTVHVA
jgi:hypothetical protein